MTDKQTKTQAKKEKLVRKAQEELTDAMDELVQDMGGTFAEQE